MNEAREPRVKTFALCMCCGTISSSMLREVISEWEIVGARLSSTHNVKNYLGWDQLFQICCTC
jgi:hypothetical protein